MNQTCMLSASLGGAHFVAKRGYTAYKILSTHISFCCQSQRLTLLKSDEKREAPQKGSFSHP